MNYFSDYVASRDIDEYTLQAGLATFYFLLNEKMCSDKIRNKFQSSSLQNKHVLC